MLLRQRPRGVCPIDSRPICRQYTTKVLIVISGSRNPRPKNQSSVGFFYDVEHIRIELGFYVRLWECVTRRIHTNGVIRNIPEIHPKQHIGLHVFARCVVGRRYTFNYYAWVKTWVAARALRPKSRTYWFEVRTLAIMSVPSLARVSVRKAAPSSFKTNGTR